MYQEKTYSLGSFMPTGVQPYGRGYRYTLGNCCGGPILMSGLGHGSGGKSCCSSCKTGKPCCGSSLGELSAPAKIGLAAGLSAIAAFAGYRFFKKKR